MKLENDKPGMRSMDNKELPRGTEITDAINKLIEVTSEMMGERTSVVVAITVPDKGDGLIRALCLTEEGTDLLDNAKTLWNTLGAVQLMIQQASPLAAVDLSDQRPN